MASGGGMWQKIGAGPSKGQRLFFTRALLERYTGSVREGRELVRDVADHPVGAQGLVSDHRDERVRRERARIALRQPPVVEGMGDPFVQRAFQKLFSRPLKEREVAQLAGALPGSRVEVVASGASVYLEVFHPHIAKQKRHLQRYDDPETGEYTGWELVNDYLKRSDDAPAGTGLAIFSAQVRAARQLGARQIRTDAAGSPGGSFNGYYTWPRFGYNRRLTPTQQGEAESAGLGRPNDLHALMQTPGGAAWWKQNGGSGEMTFDLRPGSTSLAILDGYLKEKGKRGL